MTDSKDIYGLMMDNEKEIINHKDKMTQTNELMKYLYEKVPDFNNLTEIANSILQADNNSNVKKIEDTIQNIDNISANVKNVLKSCLYLHLNNPRKSIQCLENIPVSNRDEYIFYLFSLSYIETNELDKALSNALMCTGENIKYMNNIAYIYILLNEFSSAELYLKKVLLIDTNNPVVYRLYGRLYFLKQEYNDAISSFERAYILDKNNLISNYYLGKINLKLRNYNKTIFYFQNCIKLDKENEEQYLNYIIGCYTFINADKAFKLIKKISKKYKNRAWILSYYGFIFMKKEKFILAEKYLLEALHYNEPYVNNYVLPKLILVLMKLNKIEESIIYTEQFLDSKNKNNENQLLKILDYFDTEKKLCIIKQFLNTKYKNELFFIEYITIEYLNVGYIDLFLEYALKSIMLETKNSEIYYTYIIVSLVGKDITNESTEINISNLIKKLKKGQFDFLIDVINKAITLCDYNKDLWRISAEIYYTVGDLSSAKILYNKILKEEVDDKNLIKECKQIIRKK